MSPAGGDKYAFARRRSGPTSGAKCAMGYQASNRISAGRRWWSALLVLLISLASPACRESERSSRDDGRSGGERTERTVLSEEGRAYIWEIEHRVNVLKDHGFARIANAISERDGLSLTALLASRFAGWIPEPESGMNFDSDVFRVRSDRLADGTGKLSRSEFVSTLLARVEEAGGPSGKLTVRTHVITLSPLERSNLAGAWTGTGKIEVFSDEPPGTKGALVLYLEFSLDELSKERLAGPGWLNSLKVSKARLGRAKKDLMREVAAERGIDPTRFWDNWDVPRERRVMNTGGIYLCDFNNDERHDVFVTDMRGSLFYVGEPGGMFREATRQLGISGRLGGGFAAFIDLDGDGWEDLIHGVAHHPEGYRIYRNLNGRFFQDITERSNLPEHFLGMALEKFETTPREQILEQIQIKPTGLSVADYDLDGRLDLYVTRGAAGGFKSGSWIDGKSGKLANNQLLRNVGDWQFEDVTGGSPLDGGTRSTSNAVWLHANDDLRPDLYVTDEFGDGLLLVNGPDGSFTGRTLNNRPTDFGSMGMTAGDINNDGHTDIYIGEMYSKAGERVMRNIPPGEYDPEVMQKLHRLVDGSQLYLGAGKGAFRPAGIAMGVHAVGWAWGPSLADLNNDGWLDLYATAGFISQERGKPDG